MKKTKSLDDDKIINIKVENKDQIISNFSYDENDRLNKDLSEYIVDKSKNTRITQDIQLNIYSKDNIDKSEIQSTIKNHFQEEYLESKSELKRLNIFIITMFVLGVLTFAILVAFSISLEAPVVTVSNTSSSAARPARETTNIASNSFLEFKYFSSSGTCIT